MINYYPTDLSYDCWARTRLRALSCFTINTLVRWKKHMKSQIKLYFFQNLNSVRVIKENYITISIVNIIKNHVRPDTILYQWRLYRWRIGLGMKVAYDSDFGGTLLHNIVTNYMAFSFLLSFNRFYSYSKLR